VTPELYLGYARGQIGNPRGDVQDEAFECRDPGNHAEGFAYLSGPWTITSEAARAEDAGATMALRYTAMEANLVMAPADGSAACVEIQLGEGQRPGTDVKADSGRLFVTVDRARMYGLVANESVTSGGIKLIARGGGWSAFAFTFISCAVAES
jgi:hypothetical protein